MKEGVGNLPSPALGVGAAFANHRKKLGVFHSFSFFFLKTLRRPGVFFDSFNPLSRYLSTLETRIWPSWAAWGFPPRGDTVQSTICNRQHDLSHKGRVIGGFPRENAIDACRLKD